MVGNTRALLASYYNFHYALNKLSIYYGVIGYFHNDSKLSSHSQVQTKTCFAMQWNSIIILFLDILHLFHNHLEIYNRPGKLRV